MLADILKGRFRWSNPASTPIPAVEPVISPQQRIAPGRTQCWRTASYSPRDHAEVFLQWLNENSIVGCVGAHELQNLYRRMALDKNFAVRPWNPVARELRMLLGGRKQYRWVVDDIGVRHRLRIYRIPASPNLSPVAPRASGDTEADVNRARRMSIAPREVVADQPAHCGDRQ
jgi:hypothetical protein